MSALPEVYRRHLDAVVGNPRDLDEVWEPDGVLEFPYADSAHSTGRLIGIDAMIEYFGGLTGWTSWTFRDEVVRRIADEFLIEIHGSAIKSDGRPYEQDYIVRFGVSSRGRIVWMREFWDPTRLN